MPEQARVTSLEAIESFRTALVLYLGKARSALEEVSADVTRTRVWLENDQRVHWEGQVRRRARQLEDAQQALFSARMAKLRTPTDAEAKAVQKARRAVEDAETKLRTLKRWNRDFDGRVQPLVKQMEKLHTILTQDMVNAVAALGQIINTLHAYADVAPGSGSGQQSGGAAASSTPLAGGPEQGGGA